MCHRWTWKWDPYLKMDSIFLCKNTVRFLLFNVTIQTRIFMTSVCLALLYKRKLQQNSLTVPRNDRKKWFGLLMLKICANLLNKLLYSKWCKIRKEDVVRPERGAFFCFSYKNAHPFVIVIIWYSSLNSLQFISL